MIRLPSASCLLIREPATPKAEAFKTREGRRSGPQSLAHELNIGALRGSER